MCFPLINVAISLSLSLKIKTFFKKCPWWDLTGKAVSMSPLKALLEKLSGSQKAIYIIGGFTAIRSNASVMTHQKYAAG